MKLLKILFVLGVLLLALAAGLIAFMPAKFALDALGTRLGALKLDDVSGTIWRGRAGSATVNGWAMGALDWNIHPLAMLGGRLDADLGLQGAEFRGNTFASIAAGNVLLRNTQFSMDAQRLQPAIDIPSLQLRGRVDIALSEAELVAGFPRKLKGEAHWRDAAVSGEAEALLGTLSAQFQSADDGAIIGTLQDEGGPLALEGQFRAAFTGYEADAVLSARDGNPQVIRALSYVGEVQPDGSSLLQIRGRLLPLP